MSGGAEATPLQGAPLSGGGLAVRGLKKTFAEHLAVDGVTFQVAPGEVLALLGPSGCGKSTLLQLVAGLLEPDGGSITWDGASLAALPAHRRGFGLMFQDYALFPHLNVAANIGFGLKMAGQPRAERERRVAELLDMVDLADFGGRDVATLSGGEQQRVALARALAPRPRLLMLDEPLAALDRALRRALLAQLRGLLASLRQTALYVTHDQEEAFALADRIVLLAAGRVVQVATPTELYRRPANAFAARFLGLENLVPGQVRQEGDKWLADTALGPLPLPSPATGPLVVLLRPDSAHTAPGSGRSPLAGTVLDRVFQGRLNRVVLEVTGTRLAFDLPAAAELPPPGAALTLWLDPTGIQVLEET